MLPGITPVMAGLSEAEPAILAFTYLGTASGVNSVGSFSINFDIGAAHANKTVLVVGHGGWPSADDNTGFVSITIGGVGATTRIFEGFSDGSTQGIAAWIISAEVSAAGVVAVAGTYSPSGVAGTTVIDVYTTTQDFTVTEVLSGQRTTAVSPMEVQVLLDVSEGGTIISGMTSSMGSNGTTWTGVTEVYDAGFGSSERRSGGHSTNLGVESNRIVKSSQTIADSEGMVMAAISLVKTP